MKKHLGYLILLGLIPRSLLQLLPHSREALPLSTCGEGTKGRGGFQILRSLLRGSSLERHAVPLLLLFCSAINYAEFEFGLDGTIGYYLFPSKVNGHVVELYDYQMINSGYVSEAPSGAGYYGSQYAYSHPFAKEAAPNIGFRIKGAFFFPEQFGIGLEYGNGFSIGEYSSSQTTVDSAANTNPIIPADYQKKTAVTQNVIYMKHSLFGLTLFMRKQLTNKTIVGGGIGLGLAHYTTIFKIEQSSVATRYYQQNGHEVYYENLTPQAFDVIGIDYSSFYIRPELNVRHSLSTHLGFSIGLSIPLSYIERGNEWTDGDELFTNYSSTVFYPEKRFVAGSLTVSMGLSIVFGPGLGREATHE